MLLHAEILSDPALVVHVLVGHFCFRYGNFEIPSFVETSRFRSSLSCCSFLEEVLIIVVTTGSDICRNVRGHLAHFQDWHLEICRLEVAET